VSLEVFFALAAALAVGLFGWGVAIDRIAYSQIQLWTAVQLASLGGAALAAAFHLPSLPPLRQTLLVILALLVWRITYFPLMVFSGHVASIAEWVQAFAGLPIVVYGVFLVSIAALHTLVGFATAQLVAPFHPLVYAALAPVFLMAIAVSFSKPADLHPLPDRFFDLAVEAPPPVAPRENPYFPRLVGPGYLPHQRVVLLAAGLTYETIPPSPWGRTVKSVLEVLFNGNPHGSTADRVREHYLSYASAHPLIGRRSFAELPPLPLAAPRKE
jgi:hypothetical protein